MSGSIFSVYLVHGYHEAYYQLSDEQRNQFWDGVMKITAKVGSKTLLVCNSRWCDEAVGAWGVEEFPSLQALQESARLHEEGNHYRYLRSTTILGTKIEGAPIGTVTFPNPIYQLFLIKNQDNNAREALTPEERDQKMAYVTGSIQQNGGVMLVYCDCNWSNEENAMFGVTAWPSLEAEQAHFRDLEKVGWHRYVYGRTILGTALTM